MDGVSLVEEFLLARVELICRLILLQGIVIVFLLGDLHKLGFLNFAWVILLKILKLFSQLDSLLF